MTPPPKKNTLWIWFFVFVVVASIGVASFMIWFNMRLQLTQEKLEAAMKRWKEQGPADYSMTVTKRFGDDHVDTFKIKVHAGKVVEARLNGELLRDQETDEVYPPGHERLQYYTMDSLLREIERFLDKDAREKRTVYNVAYFDSQTGALLSYTRSDRASGMHVKEEVTLEPNAP
jgi:hypothetical protein